ncbi:MAG: hypothetical protein L0212_06595, partial [Acidobacteria bacterium]|nr:hypothetical protein [Acidobacteriota bacterium]
DSPISFTRDGTIFNAIHFNRRDRLDATEQETHYENINSHVRHAYDLMVMHVAFPQSRWPGQFTIHAINPDGQRDEREAAFASGNLYPFHTTCTVLLTVPYPLPGYNYRIVWDLPPDEASELGLQPQDAGMAEEIVKRLLTCRNASSAYKNAIEESLASLESEILSVDTFRSPIHDEQLELTLFCYERKAGGLACVAAKGRYSSTSRIWAWAIKPGRTIIGQAYRRREEVLCIQLPGMTNEASVYYEPTPEAAGRAPERHTVVFAIPLFYPATEGRRVAIMSLASRSNTSGLLNLANDQAARLALTDQVRAWYATQVAKALGFDAFPVPGHVIGGP